MQEPLGTFKALSIASHPYYGYRYDGISAKATDAIVSF